MLLMMILQEKIAKLPAVLPRWVNIVPTSQSIYNSRLTFFLLVSNSVCSADSLSYTLANKSLIPLTSQKTDDTPNPFIPHLTQKCCVPMTITWSASFGSNLQTGRKWVQIFIHELDKSTEDWQRKLVLERKTMFYCFQYYSCVLPFKLKVV